jgi:hypothetical protein
MNLPKIVAFKVMHDCALIAPLLYEGDFGNADFEDHSVGLDAPAGPRYFCTVAAGRN